MWLKQADGSLTVPAEYWWDFVSAAEARLTWRGVAHRHPGQPAHEAADALIDPDIAAGRRPCFHRGEILHPDAAAGRGRRTKTMRILVIEDEPKAARYLARGLGENGFVVDLCSDGEEGLSLVLTMDYDLLIIDVMLPGRDGWSILAELRRRKNTPVIFVTARDGVGDRVKGLELGADDYLVKPFSFSELLARVRSVLRRGPVRQPAD